MRIKEKSRLCECGCGEPVRRRFVSGHNNRPDKPEFIEDPDTGCWLWQRSLMTSGYARVFREGRTRAGHREYYERHIGPIPDGLELDHLCRNRRCVNPGHLEPVTRTENIRRGINGKLPRNAIAEIRAARGRVTQQKLAERFGVTQTTISALQLGKTWRDEGEAA
jgi:HNH endonuclease